MRSSLLISGIAMVLSAIPSYLILPSMVKNTLDKFSGGSMSNSMNQQIFSQLGFPPLSSFEPAVRYFSIGMLVAGLVVILLGILLKKVPKSVTLKLNLEGEKNSPTFEDANTSAIHLLQERLARGEITSSQYQNLRKIMEEKR